MHRRAARQTTTARASLPASPFSLTSIHNYGLCSSLGYSVSVCIPLSLSLSLSLPPSLSFCPVFVQLKFSCWTGRARKTDPLAPFLSLPALASRPQPTRLRPLFRSLFRLVILLSSPPTPPSHKCWSSSAWASVWSLPPSHVCAFIGRQRVLLIVLHTLLTTKIIPSKQHTLFLVFRLCVCAWGCYSVWENNLFFLPSSNSISVVIIIFPILARSSPISSGFFDFFYSTVLLFHLHSSVRPSVCVCVFIPSFFPLRSSCPSGPGRTGSACIFAF